MWFRASLFSVLAVATALAAIVLGPYIPSDLPTKIGADAVDNILGIIASSMLAVTTFSLSTMVSAYAAATSNVTPRATRLVMEDSTTQNVLATFVGSFLFSLVGIVALSTGAYGDTGRVVLFVVTVGVIVLITETTARVENAASQAVRERYRRPNMGGRPSTAIPDTARPIYASRIGYVQHLDVGQLSRLAEAHGGTIHVEATPGSFVAPTDPIAWAENIDADDLADAIRACFTIDDVRSFDQDPRFGISVLAEIASRALSPGINDPGTAIDVIGRAVRIFAIWAEPDDEDRELPFPNIHIPAIAMADLFDDLFTPIARDGAGVVEVSIRLQKALCILARLGPPGFADNAKRHARLALNRAEAALALPQDIALLRALADEVERA
jgi:uncharacterized membrane protein